MPIAAVATLALCASLAGAPPPDDGSRGRARRPYDWGVAFYMAYDNDLDRFSASIISLIEKGVRSGRLAVAVQGDFADARGMRRMARTSRESVTRAIDSEDSADEDRAIEFLEWFVKTYEAERYVIVFLDHGGRLDEMNSDLRPGASKKRWMSGRVLGEKLRLFSAAIGGEERFELLFLQQCARGSIENLYSFRGTAKYVMSSPVPVGAPNTYYTEVLSWLGRSPSVSGADIAEKIAAFDDHYSVYTCARGAELEKLPERLEAMIAPFLSAGEIYSGGPWPAIHTAPEPICDAAGVLEGAAAVSGIGREEVLEFFAWVNTELFTMVRFHRRFAALAPYLSGLAIYAPNTREEAARYQSTMEIYERSPLLELWAKMIDGAEAHK